MQEGNAKAACLLLAMPGAEAAMQRRDAVNGLTPLGWAMAAGADDVISLLSSFIRCAQLDLVKSMHYALRRRPAWGQSISLIGVDVSAHGG